MGLNMSDQKQSGSLKAAGDSSSFIRTIVYVFFSIFGVYAVVMGLLLIASIPKELSDTHQKRAENGIRMLEVAVWTFEMKHHRLPDDLRALTVQEEGESRPILSEKQLLDPWGQLYRYDPKRLDPNSIANRPLIWSFGPPGANAPISTWTPAEGLPK